jgi:uncharacterized protein (DUF433 family)
MPPHRQAVPLATIKYIATCWCCDFDCFSDTIINESFYVENKFPDIVCTEGTLGGSPRISGRRLAVGDVVSFVKNYGTLQEIKDDFELSQSQIRQALQYCSNLQCKEEKPILFCHNCSLRREQEGPLDISGLKEITSDNAIIVEGDNSVYFGSMNELLSDWDGCDWWVIATDLLIDLRDKFN